MAVLFAVRDLAAQIVHIPARAVDDLAHIARAVHCQRHKLALAVAAVLEEHKVRARRLVRVDEGEAVLDAVRAADLEPDVHSRLHRVDGDRDVAFPAGRDDHRVKLPPFAEREDLAIVVRAKRSDPRFFGGEPSGVVHAVGVQIAHGDEVEELALKRQDDVVKEHPPALTEPDEPELYEFVHNVFPYEIGIARRSSAA